jgi:ferritin
MKDSNQNILIQEVSDSTLTLNINGEVKEIRNELAGLKELLQNLKVQNVQYAEKIYNIEHINEANFGFVTGKKAFNETLTKELIYATREHCTASRRFLEKVKNIPDWENRVNISDKAKEIIAYSFVGVIGIQFSKLMAIGKEDFSETKQRKYIAKCVEIAKRSLDLLTFALVSRLWDAQQKEARSFDPAEEAALTNFFDHSFEPSLKERFAFLQLLNGIFLQEKYALPAPLEEWKDFAPNLKDDSDFHQAGQALAALNERLDKAQHNLLDCFAAEKQLARFFQALPFLVNYQMASIRQIGYKQPRNAYANYLHRYTALGIDNKANVDAEKINFTPETVQTDAVLLYRDDNYSNHISLAPFVIDYNALTFEHGAKVCFYRSQAIDGDILEYIFLEDNSVVQTGETGYSQR